MSYLSYSVQKVTRTNPFIYNFSKRFPEVKYEPQVVREKEEELQAKVYSSFLIEIPDLIETP